MDDSSIIDDFCYFSTRVRIGKHSHIASGCAVVGGPRFTFQIGDFSSLSSGVKILCASSDFANDLVVITPLGLDLKNNPILGDVLMGNYTGVGANSVIMPGNVVPEGSVIGAMSFVPPSFAFEPWSVYAGTPLKFLKKRNRDNVLRQIEILRNYISGETCPE